MGCAAAVVISSDLVMEVQAGRFHSIPTHKGHPNLKKKSNFFLFLRLTRKPFSLPTSCVTLTTDADRVPASCSYTAHGHPPQCLHYLGLLLRGEASVPQLTMAVEFAKKISKYCSDSQ